MKQALAFLILLPLQAQTAYQPITTSERWAEFRKDNFTTPAAYVGALGPALYSQVDHSYSPWPLGAEGYARRTGYFYGMGLIESSIRHSTAAALGNEVRYERSNKTGLFPRAGHAIGRNFVTRNRQGHLTPNVSTFMSSYGSGMLSTYMLPQRFQPTVFGVQQGHIIFSASAGLNLFREFSPDLKKLVRRHK